MPVNLNPNPKYQTTYQVMKLALEILKVVWTENNPFRNDEDNRSFLF